MKRASILLLSLALTSCDDALSVDSGVTYFEDGGCDALALFAHACGACHDEQTRQSSLDLTSADLAARVYAHPALARPDYLLVDPELPEESALLMKVSTKPPFGSPMPPGPGLNAVQKRCIEAWVMAIADGGVPDAGTVDAGVAPDAGASDAGTIGDSGVDAGVFDAGRFWGPVVDNDECVPQGSWCIAQHVAEPLYAVRGLSDHDIWAVGARGAAYHYDGTSWQKRETGTTSTLFDVHPVAADDVWAVGERGLVIRYHGGAWSVVNWAPSAAYPDAGLLPSGQPTYDLGGVWSAGSDVWIVGGGGTIALASGGTLRVTHTTAPNSQQREPDLLKLWRRDDGELWAAGDMSFKQWSSGTTWATGNGGILRVFGLWGARHPTTNDRILIAVGEDARLLRYGYSDPGLYPWQPPNWSASALELTRDLRSIWLDESAHGWTVGLDGEIVEIDAARSRYTRHLTPTSDHLLGVWGTAFNASWAVGGRSEGTILRSR